MASINSNSTRLVPLAATKPDPVHIAQELTALAALGQLDSLSSLVLEIESMLPTSGSASVAALLLSVALELRAHGELQEAKLVLRHVSAAVRARPAAEQATAGARRGMGRVLYLLDDFTGAKALFTKLSQESPQDPDYLGMLGLIAMKLGDRVEAMLPQTA